MLPEAVQQVIINLVVNAVDAMEQSAQPRLGVRTFRSGDWCAIEISDNGHGIPEEHRKRLFEPFFTTKPVGKGTGLGLSITYSLVQAHGGELDVDSVSGEGSRFTVRLPATTDGAAPSVGSDLALPSRAQALGTAAKEPPVGPRA